jgi:hypothetical protein
VTGGLSTLGLANVAVRDSSEDFTFVVDDHRYRCQSSVAQSFRISKLHSLDATISKLKFEIEVDDGEELFGSVLEAVGGSKIWGNLHCFV